MLWGTETSKAVENFHISGEPIPARVVHWLGRIKSAAAGVNADLDLLDGDLAAAIVAAGDAIAAGEHDDEFPIDVFQTGSGTSSNMNANEVISSLTDGRAHPNDHVNLGQSSNDVFPSAVHLAALQAAHDDLVPALVALADALAIEGGRVRRRREVRPHAPDGRRAGDPRSGVRRVRGPGGVRGGQVSRDVARARPDPARRHRGGQRAEHAPGVRRTGPAPARRTDLTRRRGPHRRTARSLRRSGVARRARRPRRAR